MSITHGPFEPARPDGFVYFVQPTCGGFIKIGWSASPEARLKEMHTFSPLPLRLLHYVPGNIMLERVLHERFRNARQHGEWFEPVPALLEQIEAWKLAPPPEPDWSEIWPSSLPQQFQKRSEHHGEARAAMLTRAAKAFDWPHDSLFPEAC